MEDFGAGAALGAAIKQPGCGAGDRIGAVAIAEGRIRGGGRDFFHMLQAGTADRLGKARVDLNPHGGDMRIEPVDNLTVLLILVEAQIQEGASHAAAL